MIINKIEELENEIYKLYEEGVQTTSKKFRKNIAMFIDTIKKIVPIEYKQQILINIITSIPISHADIKLISNIINNDCIIKTSTKTLSKQIELPSTYLFCRLISLESKDIIKTQDYNNIKLTYIHPKILEKWNNGK